MAATQQLGDDVWTYTDAPAPKVNDVLNQVADFLSAVGFKKTLKAIEKEAKGDGFEIDIKAWKQTVADGSAPALTQLWHEWQAKKGGKAEVDDDSSSASSSSESESSSEDSDSDSDSDDEAMVIDVKAVVASSDSSDSEAEVKPKAKKDSKRKRSPTPSSSSASSSEESSDSDSSSDDDASPAKKRVVEKKASSDSSSDSSSSESESSSSDDSSSSEESSSSESEAEAPAPKKKDSKKDKKETKEPKVKEVKKEKKEKKDSSKSEDVSASSSATLGRPSPDAVEESAESTSVEDPTAGMHPSRLAMLPAALKPKVVAVAVVDADGKKIKKQNVPFSRIAADQYVDPRLSSNAYVPYDYAEKAHRDLIVTKGKGFTKEKNKKKRGKLFDRIERP
jgi:hypothetical protein